MESADSGKTIGDAREDIAEVAYMFEYYGGWATKIDGDSHHVSADAMFMVWKEPVGVAVGITPWNYPLMMAAQKVAPAIATGCTFVLKPRSRRRRRVWSSRRSWRRPGCRPACSTSSRASARPRARRSSRIPASTSPSRGRRRSGS